MSTGGTSPPPLPLDRTAPTLPTPSSTAIRPWRAAAVGSGLAATVFVLNRWPPGQAGWYPPCLVHQATGLHCPGCGATRALYHLLHGEPGQALHHNALFVAALPLILLAGWRRGSRWVRAGAAPRTTIATRWFVLAAILLGSFGILRNLPWEPFRWLAPP